MYRISSVKSFYKKTYSLINNYTIATQLNHSLPVTLQQLPVMFFVKKIAKYIYEKRKQIIDHKYYISFISI